MMTFPKPILGIVAYSGTGKTTLLEKIIPLLKQKNLNIGVIKHSHHDFEIDQQGKDSDRLRKAGAQQMLLTSKYRSALIKENDGETEPNFEHEIKQLDDEHLDIILVEGFRQMDIAKIEIHRPSLNKPLLCKEDPNIIALICDETPQSPINIPILAINNHQLIVHFILEFIKKSSE